MKIQSMRSNGSWRDETKSERIATFVRLAVEVEQWLAPAQKREPQTEQGIYDALAAGETITHGTDWYDRLRDADAQPEPKPRKNDYPGGRVLDCGCTIYNKIDVMNASQGSSCENCYDRMSN